MEFLIIRVSQGVRHRILAPTFRLFESSTRNLHWYKTVIHFTVFFLFGMVFSNITSFIKLRKMFSYVITTFICCYSKQFWNLNYPTEFLKINSTILNYFPSLLFQLFICSTVSSFLFFFLFILFFRFSFFLTIYLMVGNNKLYRLNPNRFVSYRISEKRWCFLTKFIFGVKGDINDKNEWRNINWQSND